MAQKTADAARYEADNKVISARQQIIGLGRMLFTKVSKSYYIYIYRAR